MCLKRSYIRIRENTFLVSLLFPLRKQNYGIRLDERKKKQVADKSFGDCDRNTRPVFVNEMVYNTVSRRSVLLVQHVEGNVFINK